MNPRKTPLTSLLTLLRKKQSWAKVGRAYKRMVTIRTRYGREETIELKIPLWLWKLKRNIIKGFRPRNLRQFTAMLLVGSLIGIGTVKGIGNYQMQQRKIKEIVTKFEKGGLKMEDIYEYGDMVGLSRPQVNKAIKIVR